MKLQAQKYYNFITNRRDEGSRKMYLQGRRDSRAKNMDRWQLSTLNLNPTGCGY